MFKLMITIKRRAGMSREDFRNYYENRHVVLAHSIMPAMQTYRRNYVVNDDPFFATVGGERGTGDGAEPPFDVITEAIYATREHAEAAMRALFEQDETSRQIMTDEDSFVDRSSIKFYVVETHQSAIPWKAVGNVTPRDY